MKTLGTGAISNEGAPNSETEGKEVGMWERLPGRGLGTEQGVASCVLQCPATCKETAELTVGWERLKY